LDVFSTHGQGARWQAFSLPDSFMMAEPALKGPVRKAEKRTPTLIKECTVIVAETGECKHSLIAREGRRKYAKGEVGRELQHKMRGKPSINSKMHLLNQRPAGASTERDARSARAGF
jgi:hypothetical protein